MVQNSSPTGEGLNPGAWAGVGIGAAGCIFVFCMWIFRWSKRSRDNIVRGEDAVGKMKRAFGIGVYQHQHLKGRKGGQGQARGKAPSTRQVREVGDEENEMGDVKMRGEEMEEAAVGVVKGEATIGEVKMPEPIARGLR